jgi:uncharacterized protein YkwD
VTRTCTHLRSRLASTAAAVGLAVAALLHVAGPAEAGPAEPELVTLANQARSAAGVAPLANRADLTGIARAWSERMAREGRLHHNPAVGSQACCWRALAENVGYSYRGAADVHRMLLASPGHRANLLDVASTEVGIGTATDTQGRIWVTQVFRRPTAQAAASVQPAPPPQAGPPAPALVGPIGSIRERWLAVGGSSSVATTVQMR